MKREKMNKYKMTRASNGAGHWAVWLVEVAKVRALFPQGSPSMQGHRSGAEEAVPEETQAPRVSTAMREAVREERRTSVPEPGVSVHGGHV